MAASVSSISLNRVGVLDGLRALAIVLVLCRHSIKPFWSDLSVPYIPIGPVDLGSIFINGWIGVDLFFVLSGFLIGANLLRSFHCEQSFWAVLKGYIPRRFFRIAPVYYLVLTIAALGLFPFYVFPESSGGMGWRYFYHLLFMQDYWSPDIVVVFWSLAIEIKFYLLAPFLIYGLLRFKDWRFRACVFIALIASQPLLRSFFAVEAVEYEAYFFEVRAQFHMCLDGLLMGVLAAFLWQDGYVRKILSKKVIATGLFVLGSVMFLSVGLSGPLLDLGVSRFDKVWLPTLVSGAFLFILLGLLGQSYGYKLFQGRGLTFIALISYSLYLVHLPLLYLATVVSVRMFDYTAMSEQLGYVLYLPFFIALSVFVATLLYVFIEKPVIDWSKRKYSHEHQGGQS